MKTYTKDELRQIFVNHAKYLAGDQQGNRANLCGADLCGANFCDANLCDANLCVANLRDANLRDADLCGADLCCADLCCADLCCADLCDVNLRGANLRDADFCGADLCDANLRDANLRDANLRDADLNGANMNGASLKGANLNGANLNGAVGNMREIKSAQFDTWEITWIQSPDGITTLQIGCQRHDLKKWRTADPRWIAAMDAKATEWWDKYGALVIALVDASPAVPYGAPTPASTEDSQCQPS